MGRDTVELEGVREFEPSWEDNGIWSPPLAERTSDILRMGGAPEALMADSPRIAELGQPLLRSEAGARDIHIQLTDEVAERAGFRVRWHLYGATVLQKEGKDVAVLMFKNPDGKTMEGPEMESLAASIRREIRYRLAVAEERAILAPGETDEADEAYSEFS